jgi:hypothetical protein
MSIQRNAQAFYLSSTLSTTGTSHDIEAESATNLLLDTLLVQNTGATDIIAEVTSMTLMGQSLNASSASFPACAFYSDNNYAMEGVSALGLSIGQNNKFAMSITSIGTASATAPVGFSISTEPTDIVLSPNLSGSNISFIFGMGKVNLSAGGTATLQATCLRDNVFLGRLVMGQSGTSDNAVQITSIKVDGIELLSSVNPTSTPTPLSVFSRSSFDRSGLQANYVCSQNSIVSISLKSTHGADAVDVVAGFFCKPIA